MKPVHPDLVRYHRAWLRGDIGSAWHWVRTARRFHRLGYDTVIR